MRKPAPNLLLLFIVALLVGVGARRAEADAKSDARTHYQAGQKLYAAGDYRGAISEFSAAQQLMPADLNNYNLALCYDKLGEAEPAIQYYREFLNKQPNADKRVEIEASVARLEAALKSASAKRADEQKKEEARRAEDARRAEEARKAEASRRPPPPPGPVVAPDPNVGAGPTPAPTGVGSTGTPATGQAVTTGDAQLDRVSSIDVNTVRNQRVAGTAGAPPPPGANPNAPPPTGAQQQPPQGEPPPGGEPPKKPTPIYKKWWFWGVIAVSAVVLYMVVTDGSNKSTAREVQTGVVQPAPDGGATLLRF